MTQETEGQRENLQIISAALGLTEDEAIALSVNLMRWAVEKALQGQRVISIDESHRPHIEMEIPALEALREEVLAERRADERLPLPA